MITLPSKLADVKKVIYPLKVGPLTFSAAEEQIKDLSFSSEVAAIVLNKLK